jgi:hypothetical protein
LLVHILPDERERFALGVVIETLNGQVVAEGLVVPDDKDSIEVERLVAWAAMQRPDVQPGNAAVLDVLNVSQLGTLIVRRCYRHGVPLVAWDMPWTLGRVAAHVGRSTGDGFSLSLAGCGAVNAGGCWKDSDYRARMRARSRGVAAPGAFVAWGVPKDKASRLRRDRRPGAFIDLPVLCGTVCGGEVESPAHAADLLGVSWPDVAVDEVNRLRAEAGALAHLYTAACVALDKAAPGLRPERAWSAGSIVGHSLRSAGVRLLSDKVGALGVEVKAAGAGAFHGPRFEAQLRGVASPMVVADTASTYPSVWSALDLTAYFACDHVEDEDVTDELRAFLLSPDLTDQLHRREVWRRFGATFGVVRPTGEHLPVQVRWQLDRVGGTVAPFDLAGGTLPFAWCDLAAAVLEGGTAPKVVRAFRLVPVGIQSGLRPLRLPTGTLVDLARDDLGEALVRERTRVRKDLTLPDHERRRLLGLLKLYANALTFGVLARHDRKSLTRPVDQIGLGPDSAVLTVSTRHPEQPGPDAFLPVAAMVTSGCRLVVAMARRALLDAGDSVAHIAADAVAVPASPGGGLHPCPRGPHRLDDRNEAVRMPTFEKLRTVFARFDPLLAPWGGTAWSEVNDTFMTPTVGLVVGVNKLILGRQDADGSWSLVRSSDADMGGHLVDPSGTGARLDDGRWWWAGELERHVLAANATRPTSLPLLTPDDLPAWADEPAVRPYRATSWRQLVALRRAVGDPGIGPFARYRRAETGGKGSAPAALGDSKDWRVNGEPIALFVLDDAGELRFAAGSPNGRGVRVLSVRDHLSRWLRENDPSMTGPRRGLREPVSVFSHPGLVEVVGRAGDALWGADEDPDADGVALTYGAPQLEALRCAARAVGRREVARRAGLSARKVRTFAAGGRIDAGIVAAVAASLSDVDGHCRTCGGVLIGRARLWCSKRCQKAGERAGRAADATRGSRRRLQPGPARWGCPTCEAVATDGHCSACNETWCTSCGAVLLGAARRGPCPSCDAEAAS